MKAPLVLVAEDNPINAQIASFQLRKIGYDADLVTNGKDFLEMRPAKRSMLSNNSFFVKGFVIISSNPAFL
ncbi:MAG: hypothetical protein K2X77_12235 [Candidatus Obscuribacterales bacterium]|nr:hypothetical protein [Candidatus Obscuribacterales bacterium]